MEICLCVTLPENQIYQVIRPRINGYIVNCTRFCTKVARNFVLRCLAASDPEEVWNVLLARILRLIPSFG